MTYYDDNGYEIDVGDKIEFRRWGYRYSGTVNTDFVVVSEDGLENHLREIQRIADDDSIHILEKST